MRQRMHTGRRRERARTPPPHRGWQRLAAALVLLGAGSMPALAQLGLPSMPGPQLPGFEPPFGVDRQLERVERHAQAARDLPSVAARRLKMRTLARTHRDRLELNRAGELMVRDEVLAIAPDAELIARARQAGFVVLRERTLPDLDIAVVVLQPPAGMRTEVALERLRALDPNARLDFNHIYLDAGASDGASPVDTDAAPGAVQDGGKAVASGRVGLIDGGIDTGASLLRQARIRTWGCGGRPVASAHGTAVASLLVGQTAGFAAAASGMTLYAADVYCDAATGGAVETIAEAFAWLASERVGVINVSLVGPPNRLLAQVVDRLMARGHVVVAAVGNDGPAAPPLYPAAYPGVVGVTAVDGRRRVLPEAGRGPHVSFAAPGADLVAASADGYTVVRGTSYAAPVVAGLLAARAGEPASDGARQALSALVATATDLGSPGRDPIFGHGLVGERLRLDPDRLDHLPRRQ